MAKFITILFVLFTYNSFSFTGKEYLEKINANYHNLQSFELLINYNLYKGHSGTKIMDSYESTFRKNGQLSHRVIYNDEIITTSQKTLVLNHELKTIQIMPPIASDIIDQDIEKSLAHCKSITVKEVEAGKKITITFKDFSSIAYSKIEMIVDAKFWVQKMTLYYATQMNFSKDFFHPEMDQARLEIDYKNLKKKWTDKKGITNLSKFIVKQGDSYRPTPLYQNYTIIE